MAFLWCKSKDILFCFQAKANYPSPQNNIFIKEEHIYVFINLYYLFIHHEYNDMTRMNGLLWERCRNDETGTELETK